MDRTRWLAERRGRAQLGVAMRAGGLVVGLLTSGCIATLDGGPDRLYSVSDEVAQARYRLEGTVSTPGQPAIPGLIERYYNGPFVSTNIEDERKFLRNEIIARRMYIIDVQYSEYEASLTRDRQTVGFLTSTASQGLTIGSTLAASQASARILSGIAGGVGAARGIYDSELIIAKSLQIIQGQMRGQRDLVARRIIDRLGLPSTEYPLSAAMMDLEDYYRAGTLNTGLINAARDSGEVAIRAGEVRGNAILIRAGSFVPAEDTSNTLQAYLSGPLRAKREAFMRTCLARPGMQRALDGSPLKLFIVKFGSEFVAVRQSLINCARTSSDPDLILK